MASVMTPRRLQKQVDEWREAREKKLAGRLQLNSDKKRTVSAMVLGVLEKKPVQLPTPPSLKSGETTKSRPSVGPMKKSLSYGDVHNFQRRDSTYPNDCRNVPLGINRAKSPYGYQPSSKGQLKYSEVSRSKNLHTPKSEPRISFAASSGNFRAGCAGFSGRQLSQHHNQTPKSSLVNKEIKHTTQLHSQKPGPSSHSSKKTESRKSVVPKEKVVKVVTFEDEREDKVNPESELNFVVSGSHIGGNEDVLSAEIETTLNSTFTLDDGASKESDSKDQDTRSQEDLAIKQKTIVLSQEGIHVVEVPSSACNAVELKIQEIGFESQETQIPQEVLETKVDFSAESCGVLLTEYDRPTETDYISEEDDHNSSSFSLCLEAYSSPMAETDNQPLEAEIHEVIINNDVYYPSLTDIPDVVVSENIELSDPLAESVPTTTELVEHAIAKDVEINKQAATSFEQTENEFEYINYTASTEKKTNPDTDEKSDQQKDFATPQVEKKVTEHNSQKCVEDITENLDVMFITPVKSSRKSRVLIDSTNIMESSTIKYVLREGKFKETNDVVITPVKRSTRKKAETPGSLKNSNVIDDLSPELLRQAKVVENPFLKIQ